MTGATFIDDELLRVGTTDFHCSLLLNARPGQLPVMKSRTLVERYITLFEQNRPAIIVELGIRRGGSTALIAELAQPEKLIAFEIAADPAPALRNYIATRALDDVVRPYYGVDQADRERLAAILDDELAGRPIDLVIDDASHRYPETCSSFETLFPRLAPGGVFVIEDWSGQHLVADAFVQSWTESPASPELVAAIAARMESETTVAEHTLDRFGAELVIARASRGDAIRTVSVNEDWLVVVRGADPLEAGFRFADLVHDHFGALAEGP